MAPRVTISKARRSERDVLAARTKAWRKRPLLRAVYHDYFQQIAAWFVPRAGRTDQPHGRVLEVGGGAGHFKDFYPGAIVTDLIPNRHIDLAVNAMRLPFAAGSVDNIVLHDLLHHVPYPLTFLAEAQRVLSPGGRIVMIEPFISVVSGVCYRLSHPEPVNMKVPIFPDPANAGAGDPVAVQDPGAFAGNQAIPTLLFFRYSDRFAQRFPRLLIRHRMVHSIMLYPLSGGFSKPVLLPLRAAPAVRVVERWLSPLAGWFGFRMLVVLEKKNFP